MSFPSCKRNTKIAPAGIQEDSSTAQKQSLTNFLLISPERIAAELAHGIYCFIFFVLSAYTPNCKLI